LIEKGRKRNSRKMTETFDHFYKDLKDTEKADSVLTNTQQIDRLLRPGSTYRNLNPYEVLQIDPKIAIEDVRKKYRRLSILVHPDKNQDNSERAQAAFDAVKKSYALLDDDHTRKNCEEIVEEAEGRTLKNMEEKRKKLTRENKGKGLPSAGPHNKIDEDDPAKFKQSVHILTMKLFADLERKRRQLEDKISTDAARKREQELDSEERKSVEKEFAKNWEDSRQGRVNSWLNFKGVIKSPPGTSAPAQPPPAAGPAPPAVAPGTWEPPAPPSIPVRPPPPLPQTPRNGPMSANMSWDSSKTMSRTTVGSNPYGQTPTWQPPPPSQPPPPPQPSGEKKKKKKEKRFSPMGFRPPKHKPESR